MAHQMPEASELISVVVPVFNGGRYLGATLRSVCEQTYRNLEIVVADDGSTDETPQIAERFAAEDDRIVVLRQRNSGVAAARNLAIAHARGQLIAPLDADDLWHPEKLARQYSAMSCAGPEVGLVYCWSRIIDAAGRVLSGKACRAEYTGRVLPHLVVSNFIGSASAPLIRRRCLIEAGGYDPGLRAAGAEGCEDHLLYLGIAERYEFLPVRAFLVDYRARPGGMSFAAQRMMRSHQIVMDRIRSRHPELPDHLFRQSTVLMAAWLAKRSFRSGRFDDGFRLLARAAWLDPVLVCRRGSGAMRSRVAAGLQ